MVLDQPETAVVGVEHRGSVVVGRGETVVGAELGLTRVGHHLVLKTWRQREKPTRVVDERRERTVLRLPGMRAVRLGTGLRQGGDGAGDGEADPGGSAGQDRATGK